MWTLQRHRSMKTLSAKAERCVEERGSIEDPFFYAISTIINSWITGVHS